MKSKGDQLVGFSVGMGIPLGNAERFYILILVNVDQAQDNESCMFSRANIVELRIFHGHGQKDPNRNNSSLAAILHYLTVKPSEHFLTEGLQVSECHSFFHPRVDTCLTSCLAEVLIGDRNTLSNHLCQIESTSMCLPSCCDVEDSLRLKRKSLV